MARAPHILDADLCLAERLLGLLQLRLGRRYRLVPLMHLIRRTMRAYTHRREKVR